MARAKLHGDEPEVDDDLVAGLLAAQFPRWAGLPLVPVPSTGTDHAIYRLGDDLAIRLPIRSGAVAQAVRDHRWLPVLAPHLPLAVPLPLAIGAPGNGYPWRWTVCRWLPGDPPTAGDTGERRRMATDLARFIAALQRIDPTGGPPPGAHNFGRGEPLADRDAATRTAIDRLPGSIDAGAVTEAWDAALRAPAWPGPLAWIHGDLSAGNLLTVDGMLSGVIDFGGLCVGDPACDLLPAWNLFSPTSRDVFRSELSPDPATWDRGRGWALSIALLYIPYYQRTNPLGVAEAGRVIEAVLADRQGRL